MLDTSSQLLSDSTSERPTSAALRAPHSAKMEDSSMPVATSSQASPWVAMPEDTVPISQAPEVASTPTSLPTKTPTGADTDVLPAEVIQLQEEMNMAMGWLITTRASMDAHCRKQVFNFEMAFCQNEA